MIRVAQVLCVTATTPSSYMTAYLNENMMNNIIRAVFFGFCLFITLPSQALDNRAIIVDADLARGNVDGLEWEVIIDAIKVQDSKTQTYRVLSRKHDANIKALAPRKIKRQRLLMLHGNMWFYKPGLSKPVPISRRQRLLGQAAYGDIVATNYADDYLATRLADEAWKGEPCYVFDLKSNAPGKTTYDRIKYWIAKDRKVGVRSDFFAVSGKLLKTAEIEYEHQIDLAGKKKPFVSRLRIHEALLKDNYTDMKFSQPKPRNATDAEFDLNLFMH